MENGWLLFNYSPIQSPKNKGSTAFLSPPESKDLLSGLAIGRTNIVNKPFVVHPSVSQPKLLDGFQQFL